MLMTCGNTPAKGSDYNKVEGEKSETIVQQTNYDILSMDNSHDAMSCDCDCFEALGLDVLEIGFLGCMGLGLLTVKVKLGIHLKTKYLKRKQDQRLEKQKAESQLREKLK